MSWDASGEWSPEGFEELVIRILFELNARTIEMNDDVQVIRRLLEADDEDEDEEDEPDGEADE